MKAVARAAVVAVLLLIVLLPIYWMVATSLKPNREITQDGTLYPHAPSLANYTHLFSQKQFGSVVKSFVTTADEEASQVNENLHNVASPAALAEANKSRDVIVELRDFLKPFAVEE